MIWQFGMAALCASRRTKNLSKKERLEANRASRWSAVGCGVDTTKKKGLTWAGLLMEVARETSTCGSRFTFFANRLTSWTGFPRALTP